MTAIIRYAGVFKAPAGTPTGPLPTITSDSFDRPDSPDIIGQLSDARLGGLSYPWQGYPAGAVAISGGKLVKGAAGGTFAAGIVLNQADVDFTIPVEPANPGFTFFIDFRRQNLIAGQTPDTYRLNVGLTTFGVTKRVAGASTTLQSGIAFASGDLVRVRMRGSVITVWVNGVMVAQITDTSIASPGSVGVSGTATATGWALNYIAINQA